MKRLIITALFALSAANAEPEWKASLTSSDPGSHPLITPSKLEYRLSWKGTVDAGSFTMDFAPKGIEKPNSFVITSTAASHGTAGILFPYKHNYWSEIHPTSLHSKFFESTETDSSETVVNSNHYEMTKVLVKEDTNNFKENFKSGQSYTFPHGTARDVFSAMLHLRSQKLEVGESHVMLLLPFKTPYLATVKVVAKEKHMDRDALRLTVAMQKINRTTHELGKYKKLKKPVTLWLSDDSDRIILEVRASAFIGDVRAILTKHEKHP